jgi:hypothetical protein
MASSGRNYRQGKCRSILEVLAAMRKWSGLGNGHGMYCGENNLQPTVGFSILWFKKTKRQAKWCFERILKE